MKIVLLTDDFFPNIGGISSTLFNLYKFLNKKGHHTIVFNPYLSGNKFLKLISKKYFDLKTILRLIHDKKFHLFSLSRIFNILIASNISLLNKLKILLSFIFYPFRFMWIMENSKRIIPHLKRINPDLIIGSNSSWGLSLFFIISLSISKKFSLITYGKDILLDPPLYLKRFYFTHFDKILVISEHMKRLLKKIYKLDDQKVEITNVGVNIKNLNINTSKNELRKKYGISNDTFVILSVGRHNPRKNFDLVIESIKKIRDTHPDLDLLYILIGKGKDTNRLKSLAKKLNLEEYIKFLGECENKKRNEFYKLSDIFVMASKSMRRNIEGFGIVFLEANYHKLPVIGAASGGIRDAIIHNKTGLLVKPNDLYDLYEKIMFLYQNPKRRQEMGEFGRKRVLKRFTWENMIKIYIKIFKNILKSK